MTIPTTEKSPGAHLSDEELAAYYRESGRRELIGELFKRYSHLVLGVCYRYMGNRDDAQDIAMGIFESLFSSLRKFEVRNFRAWLLVVTKSHCNQALRDRKKHSLSREWEENLMDEVMENNPALHPDTENENEFRIKKLHLAVGNLSPGQQHCILLFYFDGKSYQQIAETTGYSLNEVKSHIQNGKRNLKISLEQNFF